MLRTPVPADELDAPGVVFAYKNLKYVEHDFRHIKADDLDLRPVTDASVVARGLCRLHRVARDALPMRKAWVRAGPVVALPGPVRIRGDSAGLMSCHLADSCGWRFRAP